MGSPQKRPLSSVCPDYVRLSRIPVPLPRRLHPALLSPPLRAVSEIKTMPYNAVQYSTQTMQPNNAVQCCTQRRRRTRWTPIHHPQHASMFPIRCKVCQAIECTSISTGVIATLARSIAVYNQYVKTKACAGLS